MSLAYVIVDVCTDAPLQGICAPNWPIHRWAYVMGTSRPTASWGAQAGPGCPTYGSAGSSKQARLSIYRCKSRSLDTRSNQSVTFSVEGSPDVADTSRAARKYGDCMRWMRATVLGMEPGRRSANNFGTLSAQRAGDSHRPPGSAGHSGAMQGCQRGRLRLTKPQAREGMRRSGGIRLPCRRPPAGVAQ